MLGVVAVGFKGSKGLRSKSGSFVGLEGLEAFGGGFGVWGLGGGGWARMLGGRRASDFLS